MQNFEGAPLCYASPTDYSSYTDPCVDQELGAECRVDDWAYPMMGVCSDGKPYGIDAALCRPSSGQGGDEGGLDGLNVDVCGNVYATAHVIGKVYRWTEALGTPELVVDVRGSWIPNLHWGNGIGGWEKDVVYMADRDRGGLYAIEVGVVGHGEAYEPAP
jgi:sugar lactone lactonase YvrE